MDQVLHPPPADVRPHSLYKQPPEAPHRQTNIKYLNLSLRTWPLFSPAPHFSLQRCGCPPCKDSSGGTIIAIGENIKVRELVLMGTALTSAWQRKSRTFSSAVLELQCVPVLSNPRVSLEHVPPHKAHY